MNFTTNVLTFTNDWFSYLPANFVDSGGTPPLDGCTAFLFSAGPTPITLESVLSDFEQITNFTTSTPTLTFGDTLLAAPSGLGLSFLTTCHWKRSEDNTLPGYLALGYGVVDGNGLLLAAEYFPAPFSFTNRNDNLRLNVLVNFPFKF